MWLPTPVYERIPQFWFLLGLLFVTGGVYLGFEFTLTFWYIALGFVCCTYGVGIFLARLRHRRGGGIEVTEQTAEHAEITVQSESSEPATAEQ